MKPIKKIIIGVIFAFTSATTVVSMQKCPSLTHLAMAQVIYNIIDGKSDKEAVLDVMPFNLQQPFLEILAMAEGQFSKKDTEQALQKLFYNKLPQKISSALSWVFCQFLTTPATTGIDLLVRAAAEGNITVMEYLIDKAGVDINKTGTLKPRNIGVELLHTQDVTPLMAAALAHNLRSVEYLLNKGAYIHQRNKVGQTALYLAVISATNKNLSRKGYNAFGSAISLIAFNSPSFKLTQENIDRLAQENLLDPFAHNKLLEQLENNHNTNALIDNGFLVVNYLLAHKAFPNIRTKQGDTPLTAAILNLNPEIVEILLAYNANPTLTRTMDKTDTDEEYPDRSGPRTPLQIVERLEENEIAAESSNSKEFRALRQIRQLLENALTKKANEREARIRR